MKKLYAPQAASELKRSRFSLVKVLSLAIAATFLSNVTPVFSANPDFRNTFLEGVKSVGISYPQSILSVAGLNDSEDYANFLINFFSDTDDNSSIINVLTEGSRFARVGNVGDKKALQLTRSIHTNSIDGADFSNPSGLLRTVSTQRAAAKGNGHPLEQGYSASAKGYDAIALGPLAEAKQDRSIAIGLSSYANAHNSIAIGSAPDFATEEQRTTAGDEKAIAIGFQARAFGKFTIALGDSASTTQEDAIAIGHHAKVDIHQGVAIGSNSVADRADGILGYASLQQGPAKNTEVQWKSTQGAVSFGNPSKGITRQIIGVAAGSEPTDAVNVIQLKDLESVVRKGGWKLSVGGKNGKTVIMDSTVDFSTGSTNLTITKGDKDNNVKFDLSKEIAVNKVTAGSSTLDATGLVIANGPKITTGGIDVGSKKITGVATGTESTDAVNFGQLKEIKEQVATSSFVKQDAQTKFITIGKDTDGDKITIANKDNKTRILSGVASGTNDTDAVNVAQLKALKNSITSSWDLSVEGADTTSVNSTSPMDLAAGSSNLHITKGKEDNKVKFDLAKDITLESVKAGTNTLDETGLMITGGPKITTSGIDAGNKELKGVKDGALSVGSTEAVNGSQLLATNNEIADVRDSILVKQEEGMALSRSLHAEGSGVITIGKGTGGTEISILNKDNGARKISGLLGGDLSANSDEAVTGSQLFTTNQNVTTVTSDLKTVSENIAKYFGGGAKYENGAWTAPKFTVKSVKDDGETENKEYPDVADALAGVGSSITNVQNKLTEQVNNVITKVESESFVQQDKTTSRLTIGAAVEGSEINIANKTGADRIISGVGEAKNNNDAVNKSQLDSNIKNVNDNVTNKFSELTKNITNITQQVKGDALLWNDEANAFVARHEKSKEEKGRAVATQDNSKITFLLDGDVSKDSTDAVTGGQLYSLNEQLATYFGGSAGYDEQGQWKAPSFKVKTVKDDGKSEEKTYSNVADALAGVGTSVTNVKNEISKEITNVVSESLVKQDRMGLITIGAERGGNKINILNRDGDARILSGVKAAQNGDEAVNKAQLDASLKDLSSSLQSEDSAVVLYDKKEDGIVDYSSVTLGKGKDAEPVALHNVKDGVIGESSHDAINGSQINTISQDLAKFLGGDAKFVGGMFTGPTYKLSKVDADGNITDGFFKDVGSAFTGLDANIKNVNARIKEVSEGVAQDSLNWSNKANAFVARHEKSKEEKGRAVRRQENSRITFLANGDITSNSTDAINGGQLYSMSNTLATYLDSGAGYDESGQWKAPNFVIKKVDAAGKESEKSYKSVAEALSDISTSVTNVHNDVTNVVSDSLVKQDDGDAGRITIGAKTEGTEINIANKSGVDRILSGVKKAVNDNEAVNKSQLDESLEKLSNSFQSDDSAVVHYDKKDGDNGGINYTSVTLGKGKDKAAVGLHNVADGQIAKGSHDAISGGQINKIGEDVAKFLGGDAAFKEGVFTAPTYKISNVSDDGTVTTNSHNDVGSAFAGLDTSVKNVNTHLSNEVKKFDEKLSNITQAVQGDALLWGKTKGAFVATHGDNKENSKLTSLADGSIVSGSSDAITGGQIYDLQKQFATYFGGGAGYDKDGQWKAPSFVIKKVDAEGKESEESYKSVAEAFAGVASSITNVHNDVTNVVSDSLAKQDEKTKVITIGKEVEGSEVNIANKTGTDRTLSGVGEATKDNEAVNKGQLDKRLEKLSNSLQSDDSAVVHYDKKEGENGGIDYTSVTLGKGKDAGPVALHNVKDGVIGESSHDAINGSQINTISQNVAKFLGGDAKFVEGTFTGPTYKLSKVDTAGNITNGSFNDVGSAFAGLDENIKNVNARIKEVSEGVAQDSLLWNDEANAFVARHEKKQEEQGRALRTQENSRITFLANGEISAKSTDAVTGNQLFETNDKVVTYLGGNAAFNNGAFTGPTYSLSEIDKDGKITAKPFTNVGSAFEGLDTNIKNVNQRIKEVSEGVAQDSLNWNNEANAFVAKHGTEGNNSKLKFLLDGEISKGSTEAITGNQLYSMNQAVATYLGGGAGYENGKWVAPTFKLETVNSDGSAGEEKVYNSVAEALAGVASSITNVHNDVTNVVSDSLAKQDDNTKVITIGKEVEGTELNIANSKKEDRILSGVKAGVLSAESTEVVNGSQLFATNKNVTTVSTNLDSVSKNTSSYLGGGADVLVGNLPTYVVGGQSYHDVGSAFSGVDTSLTDLHNELSKNSNELTQTIEQNALLWNDEANAFVARHVKNKEKDGQV
uniref:hypothetical protein n=1 Tax=Bartonella sp. AC67GZZY TaxID=3243459 RepID=UPI0035CF38F5